MLKKQVHKPSLIDAFIQVQPKNKTLDRINELVDFTRFNPKLHQCYDEWIGRPAIDPLIMFKMLIIQRLYDLSDGQLIFMVGDSLSFRCFLGIDVCFELPDHTTVSKFRTKLEKFGIYDELMIFFESILEENHINIKTGRITIVDATIVESKCQPEHTECKDIKAKEDGAEWVSRADCDDKFGFKIHTAMDKETRLIRDFELTGAAHHEVNFLLVPEGTEECYADKAYDSKKNRDFLENLGVASRIMYKGCKNKKITEEERRKNKEWTQTRRQIESKFGEAKLHYGLRRSIYNGLRRTFRLVALTIFVMNLKRLTVIL